MRILITGSRGQLGTALRSTLQEHDLTSFDPPDGDVTRRDQVFEVIQTARPDVVIHCAAWTDVDDCARDPARALCINALGTQNVALTCRAVDAAMVHISTNEVFAGDRPAGYEEWMPLAPVNAYGRSKATAEFHVRDILNRFYIVRTAWLFAPGGRNFVHAILKRARAEGQVRVVADEVGNPTYVPDLAAAIAHLIATGQYGTYHLTNAGACSRWAFAGEILRQAGLPDATNTPILSRDYQRASTPPRFAALLNHNAAALGITLRPWQEALGEFMERETV